MAREDLNIFEESLKKMIAGDWASTDHFYCAICDDTTTPSDDDTTPIIGDYTQIGTSGTYVNGGIDLGVLSTLVTQTGGVLTFDSSINPSWLKNLSNDVDAYWAIIYNYTDSGKDCLCFLDLGGPVNMSIGTLSIDWDDSGIFNITISEV